MKPYSSITNAQAASTSAATSRLLPVCQAGAQPQCQQPSRRDALLTAISLGSVLLPTAAHASVPEIAAAGQWGLPFSLPTPPEPVRFPRKALNLRFAVLLMVRSGCQPVCWGVHQQGQHNMHASTWTE